MLIEHIKINHISTILWGAKSSRIIIAVHGNLSSKSDVPISMLAEEAAPLGYQVLSFDLPEHGDRKNEPTLCKVQNCLPELKDIMEFAKLQAPAVSVMANSMGAYFSLLAYQEETLSQSLFLSPVVNMERLIQNMMQWFDVSEERLCDEQEVSTPIGQIMYWDYYQYVKHNPILAWNVPTAILYGMKDELCEHEIITSFAGKFGCGLTVSDTTGHYFHTEEDLEIYRKWIKYNILK